ncbi:hypothetical protein CK203_106882 [Vitis vinifera]|uniref:Uncharacterized protein n=1 Tax=Vitis vinifera TaxID=29760 RepID=A0A438C4U4_VITVI|nr:hypothetical protein CK203_106882 [Vitis vinifera]
MTNQKRTHERWKNHGFEMEIDLLCRKPSVGYRDNEGHFGWAPAECSCNIAWHCDLACYNIGATICYISGGRLKPGNSHPSCYVEHQHTYMCHGHSVFQSTTIPEAFTWEFIISFILMLAIYGVVTDSRAINELSGVTVGATGTSKCPPCRANNRSFHEPC